MLTIVMEWTIGLYLLIFLAGGLALSLHGAISLFKGE